MRVLKLVRYGMAVGGIALLVGAGVLAQRTRSFLARAATAEGVVVDLAPSRSDRSTTYRPVVRFVTAQQARVEFTSSVGSNPPSHALGERVRVLYLPDEPRTARIDGFSDLWLGATILGGLGATFSFVAAGLTLVGALRARRRERLRRHGTRIEATFQRVELNEGLNVNGRHPYRIVSQWLDPASGQLHVFESENLWFDPTEFVRDPRITVFIERGNPRRYHVDVSFLPKLAA